MEITWKETRFLNVPLAPDEIQARGEQLADLIEDRDALELEHKKQKDQMKDALAGVDGRIRHLAKVVSERVEERSVPVEVRYNSMLHLIEEVRVDTGEIVTSRQPSPEDKIRAQAHSQMPIPGTTDEKKPDSEASR